MEDNKSEDKNEVEPETVLAANIKLDLIEELKMVRSEDMFFIKILINTELTCRKRFKWIV